MQHGYYGYKTQISPMQPMQNYRRASLHASSPSSAWIKPLISHKLSQVALQSVRRDPFRPAGQMKRNCFKYKRRRSEYIRALKQFSAFSFKVHRSWEGYSRRFLSLLLMTRIEISYCTVQNIFLNLLTCPCFFGSPKHT